MNSFIIETKNLSKRFGQFTAVDKIHLQVPKGEIYGFLGPNGAGKSTTIRMLLGLVKPTEGEVQLFGKSISLNRLEILKKVGSLVEHPSYYGHLSPAENLEITRRIREVDRKEIDRVLDIVRLTDVRNKPVKKFSLGMKQRLGIAQALLGGPELLILDEPTNGLDPAGIQEMRDLIKSLPVKMGITILISSHILSEIELMANHVGIINKGKLTFQGTIQELREKSISTIRIQGTPLDRARNHLRHLGLQAIVKDGYLSVRGDGLQPAQINKELVLHGIDVSHLSKQQDTLEEIFLSMTSKGD